jgi:hypothetical protein
MHQPLQCEHDDRLSNNMSMTQKISVVMLTRSLEAGGAEVQLASLAAGLPRDQFEVTGLCFYEIGPLLEPLRSAGIRVISLGKQSRWDFFADFSVFLANCGGYAPITNVSKNI